MIKMATEERGGTRIGERFYGTNLGGGAVGSNLQIRQRDRLSVDRPFVQRVVSRFPPALRPRLHFGQ